MPCTTEFWQKTCPTPQQEVDGKGYLVVVGGEVSWGYHIGFGIPQDGCTMMHRCTHVAGGTGNILENWGVQDMGDVAVLAIDSWKWIGHYQKPDCSWKRS